MNLVFYCGVVLIWGTTWFTILYQLGEVDPLVSIIYRFAIAAAVLVAYCLGTGKRMRYPLHDHLFMALMGATLFALNYWLFYVAELTLTSGLVALVFSTMVIWNVLFGRIFLGTPIRPAVLAGAALGFSGIGLVFRPEIAAFSLGRHGAAGLGLSVAATVSASLGNIVSARNQMHGIPVVQANAWGMSYGTLFLLLAALLTDRPFLFPLRGPYMASLLYLALFGSVFAFGMYLSLIGRIGADRAAYITLLFPVVALFLSAAFEGYRGGRAAITGILLILAGNLLVLRRRA